MPYDIAVAGAGPAGLTFARILIKQAREAGLGAETFTITLFESDPHLNARTEQVGTLDLHRDTGLAAMKACGLWEEFQKWARYDAEELIIADKNGTEVVHMMPMSTVAGVEEDRPEIDRQKLMAILLKSVLSDQEHPGSALRMQWGKKLVSVGQDGILKFKDDTTAGPFDLVIGSDGAWSKVRPLLTEVTPRYAGICGFETIIENPQENWPEIDKLLGVGSYFAYTDCKGLMSHRLAKEGTNQSEGGRFKVNYWLQADENFAAEIWKECEGDEKQLSRVVGQWFQNWRPEFRDCIKASSQWRHRALYELPVGHRWEHKKGFTVIGDAAHLMTPFAGKGLNIAMKDALILAQTILESLINKGDVDEAVQDFEQQMFSYGKKVQEESMFNKTHMFRADAPIGFVVDMMDVIFQAKGKSLDKGLLAWVPIKRSVHWFLWLKATWGQITCGMNWKKTIGWGRI